MVKGFEAASLTVSEEQGIRLDDQEHLFPARDVGEQKRSKATPVLR